MPGSGLNIAVTAIVPEGTGTVGAGSGRFSETGEMRHTTIF